jgi:hypothetical protein
MTDLAELAELVPLDHGLCVMHATGRRQSPVIRGQRRRHRTPTRRLAGRRPCRHRGIAQAAQPPR